MPETNPESAQLSEIEELERQLAEKKAAVNIEKGLGQFEQQLEISRENLPEFQNPIPAPVVQSAKKTDKEEKEGGDKKDIERDARAIAAMDETRKIETLTAIALTKGINHSVEVANSLRDPYILDLLHDKLIGELHEKLVKEKKLKEV